MSLEYDPVTSLRHWPTPMSRFGKNVYGENLYRIVFTQSRRHLVGGLWPDGKTAYHWVPKYRKVASAWILERWYSPFEFTKMSKTSWDSTMVDPVSGWLLLGPYPSRGEYDLVWEFDAGVDSDNLEKIVGSIERGRGRSFEDIRAFHKAEYEQEEKDTRNACRDEIRDAVTAFGNSPFASARCARGLKTAPMLRTAEELGLPVPGRRFQAPKRVGARRTQDVRDIQTSSSLIAGRV